MITVLRQLISYRGHGDHSPKTANNHTEAMVITVLRQLISYRGHGDHSPKTANIIQRSW
jgi:hypothetical protein